MTDQQKTSPQMKALMAALGIDADRQRKYLTVEMERKPGVISLPPDMSYDEGIQWLQVKRDADEKKVSLIENIKGFPLDVAHALFIAIDQRYGFKQAQDRMTFFGPQPPAFIAVPIDAKGNTVEILVGEFTLPGFDGGKFSTSPDDSKSMNLHATIKQKYVDEVKALAQLTREILKTTSLYRGKAIKVDSSERSNDMVMPTFIDTSAGREDLLLNRDIISQVQATIWNPIEYMQQALEYGIPLKRGAMLEGAYGTGKTLCANHTARIAEEHGWTFVYCKRIEDLVYAYETARQWQPAVVFAEDVDRVYEDEIKPLSTALDGVDTKDSQIMLIMTTNHIDKVPAVLIRPGRIDTFIHFSPPDAATARRLVEFYAIDPRNGRSLLDAHIDWDRVGKAVAGNIPAVIREIVERSKLGGIRRNPLYLSTEDLVIAAAQMEYHAKLSAPSEVKAPTAGERLAKALREILEPIDVVALQDQARATYHLVDAVEDRVIEVRKILNNGGGSSGTIDNIESMVSAIHEKVDA